jgi:hypothetical protein
MWSAQEYSELSNEPDSTVKPPGVFVNVSAEEDSRLTVELSSSSRMVAAIVKNVLIDVANYSVPVEQERGFSVAESVN